ncbi:MAG: hypothetical protein K2X43_09735 [Hyphomonadaceae bacterium]|jgi:hypothetical protein|nr:hypothetical protein [Hyphomonadaceae bacterium]
MHLQKISSGLIIALLSLVLGAALILASHAQAQSQAQPGSATTMTWTVKSMYQYKVQIAFYSRERNHEWPGSGQAWDLNDYNNHTYTLNCQRGEKICFGAWVTGNASKYWGVGFGGKQGCSSCCFHCGQQPQAQVLQP